jgi:hypothetical protein
MAQADHAGRRAGSRFSASLSAIRPASPAGVREPLELAAQDAKLLDMKLARRTTANVPCHRILIRQAKLAVGERLQQVGDLFTACCAHLLHHSL